MLNTKINRQRRTWAKSASIKTQNNKAIFTKKRYKINVKQQLYRRLHFNFVKCLHNVMFTTPSAF